MHCFKSSLFATLLVSVGLAGCLDSDGGTDQSSGTLTGGVRVQKAPDTGGVVAREDDRDCKLEGSDIGRVGAVVVIGDLVLVFEEWIVKADAPGEYVGFLLSVNGEDVTYVVKAGTGLYPGEGRFWINPLGDSGSAVKAISNIDFCDYVPPPPCEDNDGDGICDVDEPPCEDSDGDGICDVDEPPCEDSDGDGKCDVDEPPCEDSDGDGKCDVDEPPCKDDDGDGKCDVDEPPCEDLNDNGKCDADEPGCKDDDGDGKCDPITP